MHIVTKILVVFCAILSLLLAALTMAYASNAQALRDNYKNADNERLAAVIGQKLEQQNSAERAAKDQSALQSMQNEVASKETDLANLRAERSRLIAELEQAKAGAAAAQNQTSSFTATIDTQTRLIQQYTDEVTALRNQLLASAKKEIELVDRINDLEAAREVLEQNARALKEQLEETRLSLQQIQQGGAGGATGGSAAAINVPRELAGPIVRARVNETFSTPAGEMVVVSEGANRGIRENAKMHIIRGAQYIGSIEITTVEPTQCVGKVTFLSSNDSRVQKDDTVLSRLQ